MKRFRARSDPTSLRLELRLPASRALVQFCNAVAMALQLQCSNHGLDHHRDKQMVFDKIDEQSSKPDCLVAMANNQLVNLKSADSDVTDCESTNR
jgi:hypothetical protein